MSRREIRGMKNLSSSRLLVALMTVGFCVSSAIGQGGSEGIGPPSSPSSGPATQQTPPPQPIVGIDLRIDWDAWESGDLVLRFHATGSPGTSFLLGAERVGSPGPVILCTGILDSHGAWSMERPVTARQARAMSTVSFLVAAR